MALTDVSNPAIGGMTLRVRPAASGSSPVEFTRFLSYEYTEDYLSPSDICTFEIDEKSWARTFTTIGIPTSFLIWCFSTQRAGLPSIASLT